MSEQPQKLVIVNDILEILKLVMAIKDAYNDISKRHNRGDKVRRRTKQLRHNLSAVLQADRFAAERPDKFEEEENPLPIQVDLFDRKDLTG